MNDPRQFLMAEMAQAQTMSAFMLAYAALARYEALAAQLPTTAPLQGPAQFQQPTQYERPFPSQQPPQPNGPQPYRPNHEPSWGEDDDRMPWEG